MQPTLFLSKVIKTHYNTHILNVNAKKWVNGQSVPRMQLYEYVSYSLHVGKVIRSQVGPKSSHNELSAKEGSQRNRGAVPRLSFDA